MIYSDKQQKEFTKIICKKSNILFFMPIPSFSMKS